MPTFPWHHWFAVKLFPAGCAQYTRNSAPSALDPPSLETQRTFSRQQNPLPRRGFATNSVVHNLELWYILTFLVLTKNEVLKSLRPSSLRRQNCGQQEPPIRRSGSNEPTIVYSMQQQVPVKSGSTFSLSILSLITVAAAARRRRRYRLCCMRSWMLRQHSWLTFHTLTQNGQNDNH